MALLRALIIKIVVLFRWLPPLAWLVSHVKLLFFSYHGSQSVKFIEELLMGIHSPARPRHGNKYEVSDHQGRKCKVGLNQFRRRHWYIEAGFNVRLTMASDGLSHFRMEITYRYIKRQRTMWRVYLANYFKYLRIQSWPSGLHWGARRKVFLCCQAEIYLFHK